MLTYTGSGPYCYSHSLAMVLGPDAAPSPAVIETLTGSPFGMQLVGGTLPWFDPYGWDPETGLDAAVSALGLRCVRSAGGTQDEALARLGAACTEGPVLVGPVEMGLLLYQPGSGTAVGADHYVVVLAVEDGTVLLHDPHGHPYATLPAPAFAAAWRAESVTYTDAPYVMRSAFVQERAADPAEALRRSLPDAVRWLAGRDDLPMPPGSLGGTAAAEALADQVAKGLSPEIRGLLSVFAIRLGARRLNDAAACLASLNLGTPAALLAEQSRMVGGLQRPVVSGDDRALEAGLRRLAPTYGALRTALEESVARGMPG
ncbi:hypothetical protein ADK70_14615 [Streptomyces rimosus subsp. pseudoverticillatus]|uniref:hypothetical protein n=1 Tax=Streptomyces rimosus TaxID=1927 RepID=UPI0006B298D4|nr:hypothetical protein [Streptomyces rimosus]KOT93100.1 hypothetical protein ADK70_14615 [Streptomyces rimosus subsp. pseudoverticillatus]